MSIYRKNSNLMLTRAFEAEECLNYAVKHKMNVMFTDTGSSETAKIALMFKEAGFGIDVQAKAQYSPDGLQLPDKPIFIFLYKEYKDYPYLSQTRDFEQLKKCYSKNTLKEFEHLIKEYMESINEEENPDEVSVSPLIAWFEGLITLDDLKDAWEPDNITN